MKANQIVHGDTREVAKQLPDQSIDCIVTSPPYWGLRDYGHEAQIGLESTPQAYVNDLVLVFRELRRALKDAGTLWLNLGDSYINNPGDGRGGGETVSGGKPHLSGVDKTKTSLKPKNLVGIPWRVALALQDDGWYLRSDIVWSKPNPMPESVTDRPSRAHEYIFLLSKSERYYYDADAIREPFKDVSIARLARGVNETNRYINGAPGQSPHSFNQPRPNSTTFKRDKSKRQQAIPGQSVGTHGPNRDDTDYNPLGRNKRTVWEVSTKPYSGAHFAVFPPDLVAPCILAGCPEGGLVLDPFFGSGTVGVVCVQNKRNYLGVELNQEYIDLAESRIKRTQPALFAV